MRVHWVLVLAACGGKHTDPKASPTVTAKAPEPPPKPVCLEPTAEAATIGHATSDGNQVQFCVGTARVLKDDGKHQCFAVDLDSGAFHHLVDPPTIPDPATRARVETANPKLDVCASGTCTSLVGKLMPNTSTLRAATNEDGSYAVVLLGDAPKGRGYAEVWNVAKTRKQATIRYARGVFRCGDVAMLDNTIYLSAAQCGEPAARAGLYNLRGRRLATVGGRDFGSFGNAFVRIDDRAWAFLSENANKLVIQDVVKGKIVKRIDTTSLFEKSGAKMGTPGESAMIRLRDGRLAVIAGSPATGTIATVDPSSGELHVIPAPVCSQGGE